MRSDVATTIEQQQQKILLVALVLNKYVVIIIISMQFIFDEFPEKKASICVYATAMAVSMNLQ